MIVRSVHPTLDMVRFDKVPYDERTDGGLVLVDGKHRFFARVRGVGPGLPLPDGGFAEPCVKVGDRFLMWGAPWEFIVEDRSVLMCKDEAICAVLGPETEEPVVLRDGTEVRRHVIKPTHNFLLLEQVETDTGSLVKAVNTSDEKGNTFKVVAAGPGKILPSGNRWPMPCKPGDVVFIPGGAPSTFCEGRPIIMAEADLVCAVLGPDTESAESAKSRIVAPSRVFLA